MREEESINGILRMQTGEFETAFDGAGIARFQFHIEKRFQCFGEAEILGGRSGE